MYKRQLQEWFADKVDERDGIFTFGWNGTEEKAELLDKEDAKFIRFHWLHSQKDEYFELAIEKSEVTNQTILTVSYTHLDVYKRQPEDGNIEPVSQKVRRRAHQKVIPGRTAVFHLAETATAAGKQKHGGFGVLDRFPEQCRGHAVPCRDFEQRSFGMAGQAESQEDKPGNQPVLSAFHLSSRKCS